MKTNTQKGYGIPVAIIFAGVLVAGAVMFVGNNEKVVVGSNVDHNTGAQPATQPAGEFRIPSDSDHIRGNLDASIKIVEFSDFECPFCGRLHPTLQRIVEENSDIAWVYRHFPLSSHRNALRAAVASECVARLGGNSAFWNFADDAFSGSARMNNDFYEKHMRASGVDEQQFQSCLNDSEVAQEVQNDLSEVTSIGGRGTPFVVVVGTDGSHTSFSGALQYEQVMQVIDSVR